MRINVLSGESGADNGMEILYGVTVNDGIDDLLAQRYESKTSSVGILQS